MHAHVPEIDPSEIDERNISQDALDLNETERSRIGLALGEIRKARNISQDDAAVKIGISRSHLSNIESGRSRPGWGKLMAMAAFYDVEIETLVRQVSQQGEIEPIKLPESYRVSGIAHTLPGTHVGVTLTPWETYVIEGLAKLSGVARRKIVDELMERISTALRG